MKLGRRYIDFKFSIDLDLGKDFGIIFMNIIIEIMRLGREEGYVENLKNR